MPVYPPSNLPSASVPWGRTVQNSTESNSRAVENLRLTAEGNNRASAGQMGVVGRQINELGSRITQTLTMNSVSVTATSTTSYASSTESITVPGVGTDDRFALISVAAIVNKSGSQMSGPFLTISFNGGVVFRGVAGQAGGSTPPDWAEGLSAVFSAVVPASGGTLSIRAESQLFVAGSGTAVVESPSVAVYFSDSV